jgi:hypothetical protein
MYLQYGALHTDYNDRSGAADPVSCNAFRAVRFSLIRTKTLFSVGRGVLEEGFGNISL